MGKEHAEFKRKGADLFIERTISLVEALCGFELEITHLDGRTLLIKTSPGEIIRPMAKSFDPLADTENKMEWEVHEDSDCPSIDNVAQADTTDVDTLKKACETQLKRKGIDVGVFVVDQRRAYFKQCTREEALAAKTQEGQHHVHRVGSRCQVGVSNDEGGEGRGRADVQESIRPWQPLPDP